MDNFIGFEDLDEVNWSAVTINLLEEKIQELYIRDRLSRAEKQIKNGETLFMKKLKKCF